MRIQLKQSEHYEKSKEMECMQYSCAQCFLRYWDRPFHSQAIFAMDPTLKDKGELVFNVSGRSSSATRDEFKRLHSEKRGLSHPLRED